MAARLWLCAVRHAIGRGCTLHCLLCAMLIGAARRGWRQLGPKELVPRLSQLGSAEDRRRRRARRRRARRAAGDGLVAQREGLSPSVGGGGVEELL